MIEIQSLRSNEFLRPSGRVIIVEGANLLPVGYIQPLLMFIHLLVYGPRALLGLRQNAIWRG